MASFRSRRRKKRPIATINVTPFVDILLVLLVVFMVAAPALDKVGVPVNLPSGLGQKITTDNQPLVITIKNDGGIFLGESAVSLPQLDSRMAQLAKSNRDQKIYVRGDKNASYGSIMAVMKTVTGRGLTRVSLVTNNDNQK